MPTSDTVTDPLAFLEDLTTRYLNEQIANENDATDTARFYQLEAKLKTLVPALGDDNVEAGQTFTEFGETIWAIWCNASQHGKRIGAAVEYLRQATRLPRSLCDRCKGLGIEAGESGAFCFACTGSGTVPTEGFWPEARGDQR